MSADDKKESKPKELTPEERARIEKAQIEREVRKVGKDSSGPMTVRK